MAFNTALLPYGETLQQHRTIFHQVLRAEASVSYHEMYSRQAGELVIDLLDTKVDPHNLTHTFVLHQWYRCGIWF
jgi:hypothetical protein